MPIRAGTTITGCNIDMRLVIVLCSCFFQLENMDTRRKKRCAIDPNRRAVGTVSQNFRNTNVAMGKKKDRDASPVRAKPEKIWVIWYTENGERHETAYTTEDQAEEAASDIMYRRAWSFISGTHQCWTCHIDKIYIKELPFVKAPDPKPSSIPVVPEKTNVR